MAIWRNRLTPEFINEFNKNTLSEALAIEILEVGDNYMKARMPVDYRTVQPAGRLHGGASLALSETLGSIAGFMCIDPEKEFPVGMEINGNHIRPASEGFVYGIVRPIHIGSKTHVWETKIFDESEKLICISRLTLSIIKNDEV